MLLADSDVAAGASVVACLLAGISGVFGWLSSRESRLQARDKLEFDGERVKLASDVAHLRDEHADCERRHSELEQQVRAMGEQINELRRWRDKRQQKPPGDT